MSLYPASLALSVVRSWWLVPKLEPARGLMRHKKHTVVLAERSLPKEEVDVQVVTPIAIIDYVGLGH